MCVLFKELHSAGKLPSIWEDGQISIQDLNRTQAFWNLFEASRFLGLYFPANLKTAMQWTLPRVSFSQTWGFPLRVRPAFASPVICVLIGPGPDLPARLCRRILGAFSSQRRNPGQFWGRILSFSVVHDGSQSIIGEPFAYFAAFLFVCLGVGCFFKFILKAWGLVFFK